MPTNSVQLVSVEKIWDRSKHAAFTDLIKWRGQFYCIFRESDSHYGGINGVLNLLVSSNGIIWELLTTIEQEGWDLRDPKLSVMPDGRLMLLAGGTYINRDKERLAIRSLVSFSSNGNEWTDFQTVFSEKWLWRVTWFQGKGYGMVYYYSETENQLSPWRLGLYETLDGLEYHLLSIFNIPGKPSEATIRFLPSKQLVALIRRDGDHGKEAWIGSSFPPYEDWLFSETSTEIGGPNFLILPDETMWAAGRVTAESPYGIIEKMGLFEMNFNNLIPKLILPSGGDCSYPGMVYDDPYLWISYYSSHEGHASIYLAKILLH